LFPTAGRLFQVEYAMQAINNAAAAVGVHCAEGVVIAGEKKVASSLLAPPKTSEKMCVGASESRPRPHVVARPHVCWLVWRGPRILVDVTVYSSQLPSVTVVCSFLTLTPLPLAVPVRMQVQVGRPRVLCSGWPDR
jgi:hypothetical protein